MELPDNIEYIGSASFFETPYFDKNIVRDDYGFTYLNDILVSYKRNKYRLEIKEGTKAITERACDSLKVIKLELPEGLLYIENNAFTACVELRSIKLPNGLKRISDQAFSLCFRLKKIEIPKSVTEIGKDVFLKCYELEEIKVPIHLKEEFFYDGNAEVIYY